MIYTYIIKTKREEYYCGKTNDLKRRMKEHEKKKNGDWFKFKERHLFDIVTIINGDFEKEVKRFGVKKYVLASHLTTTQSLKLNIIKIPLS